MVFMLVVVLWAGSEGQSGPNFLALAVNPRCLLSVLIG